MWASAPLACKPASRRLSEQVEAGASWSATAEMAVAAWTRNSVPARYTERTLEEAHAQVHRSAQRVAKLRSESGAGDAGRALATAEQALSQLSDAVRRRNADAARQRIPAVASARAQLERLKDRLEQSQ